MAVKTVCTFFGQVTARNPCSSVVSCTSPLKYLSNLSCKKQRVQDVNWNEESFRDSIYGYHFRASFFIKQPSIAAILDKSNYICCIAVYFVWVDSLCDKQFLQYFFYIYRSWNVVAAIPGVSTVPKPSLWAVKTACGVVARCSPRSVIWFGSTSNDLDCLWQLAQLIKLSVWVLPRKSSNKQNIYPIQHLQQWAGLSTGIFVRVGKNVVFPKL